MELKEELHHKLKVQAAMQGITLKELIIYELAKRILKPAKQNHSIKNK